MPASDISLALLSSITSSPNCPKPSAFCSWAIFPRGRLLVGLVAVMEERSEGPWLPPPSKAPQTCGECDGRPAGGLLACCSSVRLEEMQHWCIIQRRQEGVCVRKRGWVVVLPLRQSIAKQLLAEKSPLYPLSLPPFLSLFLPLSLLTEDDIWRQLPGSCHSSVN